MNLFQNNHYECKRVCELKSYHILDTLTEKEYEEVTRLASLICQVPIALISFIDSNRQWFKSRIGMDATETERMHSFCNHAIQNPGDVMIVEDARTDSRFQDNPLVIGHPNIVFYAGVPLFNKAGYGLGTVCVIDRKPGMLSKEQVKALKILSVQVMHLLELRRIRYEHETLNAKVHNNVSMNSFIPLFSPDSEPRLGSLMDENRLLESLYIAIAKLNLA